MKTKKQYCEENFNHLEVVDIKINIDESLKEHAINITNLSKDEIIKKILD